MRREEWREEGGTEGGRGREGERERREKALDIVTEAGRADMEDPQGQIRRNEANRNRKELSNAGQIELVTRMQILFIFFDCCLCVNRTPYYNCILI